jgi:hypothetical protein
VKAAPLFSRAAGSEKLVGHTTDCNAARGRIQDLRGSLRFRHLTQHLHGLGVRPTGEFLAQLGRAHSLEREIVSMLEEYAALDPALVERLGGRDWPPQLLEVVR